jgi:hypothetical protein
LSGRLANALDRAVNLLKLLEILQMAPAPAKTGLREAGDSSAFFL